MHMWIGEDEWTTNNDWKTMEVHLGLPHYSDSLAAHQRRRLQAEKFVGLVSCDGRHVSSMVTGEVDFQQGRQGDKRIKEKEEREGNEGATCPWEIRGGVLMGVEERERKKEKREGWLG